jgi:hypothetical protein
MNGHGGLRPGAGRPRKLDDAETLRAAQLLAEGMAPGDVARELGVHRTTVLRATRRLPR